MGEKLTVGPVNKGLRNDRTAFVIDNDSFPTLTNAYQWRGRVKRKRGTSFLCRLTRFFNSTSTSYTSTSTITLNGSGEGNLITGFGLETDAGLTPGSVVITAPGPTVYTDNGDGTLSPSGTINYSTGDIIILAEAGNAISVQFLYTPNLPVMGLEDVVLNVNELLQTMAFDTVYSYIITRTNPYNSYDVSFYKNPPTGTYLGYTEKITPTPLTWNGENYQQFWTVNYESALWATNGVSVPFDATKVGMQFKLITNVAIIAGGPPATADISIAGNGLVVGDFVFINEVIGITGINFQTGYVITAGDPVFRVEFPNAVLGGAYASGGIAQYLTNRSDPDRDCLRFYDGDPTDGSTTSPIFNGHKGWVNFCPPLSQLNFSIADNVERQYYLVTGRMVLPFKDRLLVFGPVIQTSSANSQIYLQDTIIYSQNGTPYYTCSFEYDAAAPDDPTLATIDFNPILVPNSGLINAKTATAPAWFEDQTGFGGFVQSGIAQPINSVSTNEDVLILGFKNLQSKLIYTGNDIVPFQFYTINSELGTSTPFSIINLDQGVISQGARGFIITGQTQAQRIDLDIPNEVFNISAANDGLQRICSQRDFINEWLYFTFPNASTSVFPNSSLLYNYRDQTWSIFQESYTTYGQFQKITGMIWDTVSDFFPTWDDWDEPWNSGESQSEQPLAIGGNQQGFVLIRDIDGIAEDKSLFIQDITGSVVISPNHTLYPDDYIIIENVIGTISQYVNGRIFKIKDVTIDQFLLDPILTATGTYLGGGTIKKLYRPYIKTKQFPVSWGNARKTRIGPQQYLLTTTEKGQITLQIFLSQNITDPYNKDNNNSLIYSDILFTCAEAENLGLTPANINLNMVTANQQAQIWHRMNTSLLGDTVQIGFTLSDDQMANFSSSLDTFTITGASQTYPAIIDVDNTISPGTMVLISGVFGMTQLNGIWQVIDRTDSQLTLDVDATAFGAYTAGGIVTVQQVVNQTDEIEIHGFILDVSPSMVLA